MSRLGKARLPRAVKRMDIEGSMTAIPVLMKVGPYYISVQPVPYLLRDHGCTGRYIPCEKKIEIEQDLCESMQWGVFYHELIEAMTEIYCIPGLEGEENHHSIELLAEVLHGVVLDNYRDLDERVI